MDTSTTVGASWNRGWQARAVTMLSKQSLYLPRVPSLRYHSQSLSLPRHEFSSLQTKEEDAQRQKGFST